MRRAVFGVVAVDLEAVSHLRDVLVVEAVASDRAASRNLMEVRPFDWNERPRFEQVLFGVFQLLVHASSVDYVDNLEPVADQEHWQLLVGFFDPIQADLVSHLSIQFFKFGVGVFLRVILWVDIPPAWDHESVHSVLPVLDFIVRGQNDYSHARIVEQLDVHFDQVAHVTQLVFSCFRVQDWLLGCFVPVNSPVW